jgi:hypothetical protein
VRVADVLEYEAQLLALQPHGPGPVVVGVLQPEVAVHRVPAQYRDGVIDLFERFITLLAFGGVIKEGQEVRLKTLPGGMTCRHAGDVDDPDFNNAHVEITPPG